MVAKVVNEEVMLQCVLYPRPVNSIQVFSLPPGKRFSKILDAVPFSWFALENPSGWMGEESFLILLKNFRKQIVCLPKKKFSYFWTIMDHTLAIRL
jgi:hypothetical protein